jgi:hypothetical protein
MDRLPTLEARTHIYVRQLNLLGIGWIKNKVLFWISGLKSDYRLIRNKISSSITVYEISQGMTRLINPNDSLQIHKSFFSVSHSKISIENFSAFH